MFHCGTQGKIFGDLHIGPAMTSFRRWIPVALAFVLCDVTLSPAAEMGFEVENWTARFQTSYMWQKKPGFDAAYSGQNSLISNREKSYTFTNTAYLGFRPWNGGELYFNPEIAQGLKKLKDETEARTAKP